MVWKALGTRHAGFAIGDTTASRLLNGLLLPTVGVFAEAEANVAAETLRAFR